MKLLLTLYFEFFKTGLFAVGGGMATLPFLYDMSARHPDWFTTAQLADMIAVSESTPGPIGVNMATYVGFHTAGIPGGLIATIGLVTPSVIIVLLIAGGIGGAVGLLAAIPTYTVVRVIASRFFSEFKPVRRLIPDIKDEYKDELL